MYYNDIIKWVAEHEIDQVWMNESKKYRLLVGLVFIL